MQILGGNQKTQSSGMQNTAEFSIKVTAKSFGVLINGLYSNKIRAVIRELSTNAYEAHQLVNKENVPFDVKLPTRFDNNFVIRDYGPGLSEDDILGKMQKKKVVNEDGTEEEITVRTGGLYTTLFDSTKDNSNEFGGAFGLGSKSPFAYCDNFIVESIYNGVKYCYFCNKDNSGIPSCSLAHSDTTTEPSGLKIKIAAIRGDEWKFAEEARYLYKFFKTRPNITGENIIYPSESIVLSGDRWEIYNNNDRALAVMGNIAYSVDNYTGNFKEILAIPGIRLFFEIGEIEPQPNREGLSFTKNTLLSIENRLKSIKENLEKEAAKKISGLDCWWNAYIAYQPIKAKYSFIKLDFNGRSLDDSYKEMIDEEFIDINGNKSKRKIAKPLRYQDRYDNEPFTTTIVTPKDNYAFIIEDKCSYLRRRIKDYLRGNAKNAFIIPDDEVDEYVRILGIPKTWLIKASDLPKPVAAQQVSKRHKSKVHKYDETAYGNATNFWKDIDIDLENDSGYYIGIFNNRILFETSEIEPVRFKELQKFLKLKGDIYGVKKAHLEKVTSPNMVNLETEIRKFFDSNGTKIQKLKDSSEFWNEIKYLGFIKIINLSKDIQKFFGNLYDDIVELEKDAGEYSKNQDLINTFYSWGQNQKLTINKGVNSVKAKIDFYEKHYPLLKKLDTRNISVSDASDIVAYLVGKQPQTPLANNTKGNP